MLPKVFFLLRLSPCLEKGSYTRERSFRDSGSSIDGIYVSSAWVKTNLNTFTWCPTRVNASNRSELKLRALNVTVRFWKTAGVMVFLILHEVPRSEVISFGERCEKITVRIFSLRNILRTSGGVCWPIFFVKIHRGDLSPKPPYAELQWLRPVPLQVDHAGMTHDSTTQQQRGQPSHLDLRYAHYHIT